MIKRIFFPIILLLSSCNLAHATFIVFPHSWGTNDTVTNVLLNNNQNAASNVVNGNLDNTNMAAGFALFQTVSSLPSAGTQGRVDFLTSDNSLNLDNGSAWLKTITPTGSTTTGNIPYYNAGWVQLSPGEQYYPLVSNGKSSLPSYQQVDLTSGRGTTGTLAITQGGTGQTTAQAAVDALLPSQASANGKFLTSNGSASSWGSIGLVLVSATAVSAATTSGNITLANPTTTNYYVVVVGKDVSAGSNTLGIRINGVSSGSYTQSGVSHTSMIPSTALTASTGFTMRFDMATDLTDASGGSELFHGILSGTITATGTGSINTFGGLYSSTAVTNFSVIASGNYTGTVYLYKYIMS